MRPGGQASFLAMRPDPNPVRRNICAAVAVAALGLACQGCPPSVVAMMNSTPSAYARGTWTGRFLVVTMRDYDGRDYPAAAVDIETGPRVLKGSGVDRTVDPEHDLVLLCRGQGIIDPAEFNIPVGS